MKRLIFYFSLLFFFDFWQFTPLCAQQYAKVLSVPNLFEPPVIAYEAYADQKKLENAGPPYSRNPWIVVSDRDMNPTKDKPNEDSNINRIINFRDWFYAVDQKGEWIHIGKADIINLKIIDSTFQDYGWVEKSKMLLWTYSLVDATSKIQTKALIVKKIDDINQIIKSGNDNIVDIYKSPMEAKSFSERKTTFELYFVYKYENGRCLLGKDDRFSIRGVESLVGWVRSSNFITWNTRVALEPNFQKEAFDERKNNPTLQIKGFDSPISAIHQGKEGITNRNDILWENDPVKQRVESMAKSNPMRYKGSVFRFPLLNCEQNYIRSGVVGEITYQTQGGNLETIDEDYYEGIKKQFDSKANARFSYDILVAVEATPSLNEYRDAIIKGIESVQSELIDVENIRWSLVLYRDVTEDGVGNSCTIYKFTSNKNEIINFLRNANFEMKKDLDPWTTMFYGLHKGLVDLDIKKDHTTILLVVGKNGDYSRSVMRLQQDISRETYVASADIVDHLVEKSINFAVIQCQNIETADHCTEDFQDQVRSLIVRTALKQYKSLSTANEKLDGSVRLMAPTMPDMDGLSEALVQGGVSFGYIRKPPMYGRLSGQEVAKSMGNALKLIKDRQDKIYQSLNAIVQEGGAYEQVNAGDFNAGLLEIFNDLIKEGKLSAEDFGKVSQKKYKLYTQVFFPLQIKGAKYPSFSPVLFMPQSELINYVNLIRESFYVNDRSPDEQRIFLYESLLNIASLFSGTNFNKQSDQITFDDLQFILQGVSSEICGSNLVNEDINIGMVRDRRKVSDEKIEMFLNKMRNRASELQRILRDPDYEFRYVTSNNTYYWIPIDYLF